jgi:hypothetical protein
MEMKFLAVLIITGLLFSAGSVYMNHIAFADDPWANIAARQQSEEQKAHAKYLVYYQYANMDQSKKNWSGLNSTQTDSANRGRDLGAQAKMSLENAISEFNNMHALQINQTLANGYQGLSDVSTDSQGRDRTLMLNQAQSQSLNQAEHTLGELTKIQANYADFSPGDATDMNTFDRQAKIEKTLNDQEAQAASLVSKLATIDQVYVNLNQSTSSVVPFTYNPGSITNEMTHGGRQLAPQEAYSLEKAIFLFNQIHEKHLVYLQSNYRGLTSVTTDESGRDRGAELNQATITSYDNALRVYNSYYPAVAIK